MSNWAEDQAEFMKAGGQSTDQVNYEQADRYLEHIIEEVSELGRDHRRNQVGAIDGVIDTIVVCLGYLHSLNVNADKAWGAVHAANMRKVIDGKVHRRPDGQIGKPEGWYGPEEELEQLAREAGLL